MKHLKIVLGALPVNEAGSRHAVLRAVIKGWLLEIPDDVPLTDPTTPRVAAQHQIYSYPPLTDLAAVIKDGVSLIGDP